jgi:hypothetical protein
MRATTVKGDTDTTTTMASVANPSPLPLYLPPTHWVLLLFDCAAFNKNKKWADSGLLFSAYL